MSTEQGTGTKRREGRSPSYPEFGLEEAINKARRLWVEEKKNFAPIPAIQGHWGYKPHTGTGIRAVAALKSFGLLIEQGQGDNRQAKISDLAFKIIVDERPDSPDLANALKEAALTPSVIRRLWEEYDGNLPSDSTLQYVLRNRGFSEVGGKGLIEVLHSTIEFAKLAQSAMITTESESEGSMNEEDPFTVPFPSERSQSMQQIEVQTQHDDASKSVDKRVLQIPLLNNKFLTIQLPVPMTESDWDQMVKVLDAMKPGLLVTKEKEETKLDESS